MITSAASPEREHIENAPLVMPFNVLFFLERRLMNSHILVQIIDGSGICIAIRGTEGNLRYDEDCVVIWPDWAGYALCCQISTVRYCY
jgi:hypothetical protein